MPLLLTPLPQIVKRYSAYTVQCTTCTTIPVALPVGIPRDVSSVTENNVASSGLYVVGLTPRESKVAQSGTGTRFCPDNSFSVTTDKTGLLLTQMVLTPDLQNSLFISFPLLF